MLDNKKVANKISENRKSVLRRLRLIEGQVKGIQKMVEEEQYCGDILIQVSAVRSAMNAVGGLVLENYMKTCLVDYKDGSMKEKDLDNLIAIMLKYTKQN